MENNIWLSSPHMSGNEMKYIQDAFDTNWISQVGPNIDGFEKDLENYYGENVYVTALTSGTAAIHLALRLLGVGKEDFVLCQSLTFVASANPIVYLGATPIFIDSEQETWNLCPNALEDAVKYCIKKGKKPKAIIAVTLYGMPYKVEEVLQISKKYDIPVIEDSAEALGSTYKGEKCGTFGDFSILSFNGNKIITTSGGGALISKTKEEKIKTIFLATQAKDHSEHYQHSELGYNYRMSNISAGIGRGQMEVFEERLQQRRNNHSFYQSLIKDKEGITLFEEPNEYFFSNHWLNVMLIHDKKVKGLTIKDIRSSFSKKNIETRRLWKPMHLQPIFKRNLFFGGGISEVLFNKGICLPSGSNLKVSDKERISETLNDLI